MTKSIKTNCTDTELSALVVEHVAGWRRVKAKVGEPEWETGGWGGHGYAFRPAPFATSADAVLPLLEKMPGGVTTDFNGHVWQVNLCVHGPSNDWHDGYAPTFPRAACFALLKANGWTVEETS